MAGLSGELLRETLEQGGIIGPALRDLDAVHERVTPAGLQLRFVVQAPTKGLVGREVDLVLDYAELEAMRNGCSPAEVFRGPAMSWCPNASNWEPVADDGPGWRSAHYGLTLPEVEIRVWLSEAVERGYWDGELRVGALCTWRRLDRFVSSKLEALKDDLVERLTLARGGRGSHVVWAPTRVERLIGWLTGVDVEAPRSHDVPHVGFVRRQAETNAAMHERGIELRMAAILAALEGAIGREGLRRAVVAVREDDKPLTSNKAFNRRFFQECDRFFDVG